MAGNGNDALEFNWRILDILDNRKKIAEGLSKRSRKEYKDAIVCLHRKGGLAEIWIIANCERAKHAAQNIWNEQTLAFGIKPVWTSLNEYEANCVCRWMTESEIRDRLRGMSPQDQWEPTFKSLCDRLGIKLTHKYAYRPPETKDRSTTRRRSKSILVRVS